MRLTRMGVSVKGGAQLKCSIAVCLYPSVEPAGSHFLLPLVTASFTTNNVHNCHGIPYTTSTHDSHKYHLSAPYTTTILTLFHHSLAY
jgi:hypothetical protein